MGKLLSINENGVIWVESDSGKNLGVVDQLVILDEDGLKFEDDTLSVLDKNGFEINQDWDRESTFIEVTGVNGEQYRVEFCAGDVQLLTHEEIEGLG